MSGPILVYTEDEMQEAQKRIAELELRLDWNQLRSLGEPEDKDEAILYLRNLVRLANERADGLQAESMSAGGES